MPHQVSHREVRLSLNLITISVSLGMVFFAVVNGAPLTGFIRELGANDLVYSIIMALPMLSSFIQILTSYYMENSGHHKLCFLCGGFLRILWIPAVLIPLFIPSQYTAVRIAIVTILIAIYAIGNSMVQVAFFSWAVNLIPPRVRGRYFTYRTMIYTIPYAIAGLLIGLLLDHLHGFGAYAFIFILVTLFGLADIACFIWVKDLPHTPPQSGISLGKLFWEPFKDKNYVKYLQFAAIWSFGLNFAGPFFNVYMLENLRMSFFNTIFLAQVASNMATILFIRVWGKIIDRYGNKPVLVLCSAGIIIAPFLWCLATPANYFLIVPLVNILVGIFQPGCDITVTNLSVWLAPDKNRSIYIANYTLATSLVGGGLAFICGGAFMQYLGPFLVKLNLPFLFGQKFHNFHSLFIIAGLIRFSAIFGFIPQVRERQSKGVRKLLRDLWVNLKKNSHPVIIHK